MDDRRVGLVIRALRRRRGWRQQDLALASGVSQSLISAVERGHLAQLSVDALRRILGGLEVRVELDLRWRGGQLDRLLDEGHAALGGSFGERLRGAGWTFAVEVTYSRYGERGSIDILAWHAGTRSLLVIEIKTEITSLEGTLRKLDEKERLAPWIARERFGWDPLTVSRLLVVRDTTSARRVLAHHALIAAAALPDDPAMSRRWVRRPRGRLSGRVFVSGSGQRGIKRVGGGPDRVRVARPRTGGTNQRS